MKLHIVIDTTVSPTIAATMKRTGFQLAPDGTGMKIVVPNSPTITRRKVKVQFTTEESDGSDSAQKQEIT